MRGDPHEVFRPREGGLTRIRCFSVVVVVVVLPETQKCHISKKINKLAGPGRPEVLKGHNSLKTDSWWLNLTKWVFKGNKITTVKINKFDTFQ